MKILKIIIVLILGVSLIQSTYTNYDRNIDDEYMLYNFTRDIVYRLEKFENSHELKLKVQKYLLEISWKTEQDLNKYYRRGERKYVNFREYAIEYIYKNVIHETKYYYIAEEWRILENSFARIFANSDDIYMTEQWVFFRYDTWREWKMIEFFKTDENIEDYLNNYILEKKFHWKCKVKKIEQHGFLFTLNSIYILSPSDEYLDEYNTQDEGCWKYWSGHSVRYFENRWDYIIYINAWQEFSNLYYDTLEIK